MRRLIPSIAILVLVMAGIFIYLELDKKNESFTTPQEALKNIKEPTLEVNDMIDTIFFEDDNKAFVVFYTQIDKPKDYIALARFNKNKYGWIFVDMRGVGHINAFDTGDSSGIGGEYDIGLAQSEVAKVRLGIHEAELIPLEEDIVVWLFHNVSPEDLKENELLFLDEEGKIVENS
ncbi:hypothetical protein [Caldalkalibacillus salinus]|uniref:hypothetical protein n=1 Tax=Caldalkalibacillus salinus TaxID=2803787 RepID=UPI001924AB27|nr:hypothetical protein [Caldalkalibacillus salinus]